MSIYHFNQKLTKIHRRKEHQLPVQCYSNNFCYQKLLKIQEVRIAQLVESWTHDQRVWVWFPAGLAGELNLLQTYFSVLTLLILCLFHPCVTTVACKRPKSFYPREQVTPKSARTLDSKKLERADYAVQASCGNLSEKWAHTQFIWECLSMVISASWATVDWSLAWWV